MLQLLLMKNKGEEEKKPTKFNMLCLIRLEPDVKYCEGAKKTLSFAQNIGSTSDGNSLENYIRHITRNSLDYLSIKRHDKKPCRNWTDFQQIKNMICKNGENRFAVEIYPPEKFLVNSAK